MAGDLQARWNQALQFERSGQVLQAELVYLALLKDVPGHPATLTRLARLAMKRGDSARALGLLQPAAVAHPDDADLAIALALAWHADGQPAAAAAALEALLTHSPATFAAWLMLGQLRETAGDAAGALKAFHQAITRAQRAGQWLDSDSTPAHLIDTVAHAAERVRAGRRELFFGAFESLRSEHGAQALARVERALTGYLREWDATPPDPRQRPKFFYFPGLPDAPYHDPYLHPWARRLADAYPQVRGEALRLMAEDRVFEDFIDVPEGAQVEDYLGGTAAQPTWEAFFFYRHGQRYDANHARCPATSALLESIDLCRIADQAPEICFSVLTPGTTIKPHYGVSNVRHVVHLPLLVPGDCALNVIGAGEHHWREGELMMFDDTYQHEAWNRSDSTRVVLLMDCWNPYLSEVEKIAVRRLIETIGGLRQAPSSGRPQAGDAR